MSLPGQPHAATESAGTLRRVTAHTQKREVPERQSAVERKEDEEKRRSMMDSKRRFVGDVWMYAARESVDAVILQVARRYPFRLPKLSPVRPSEY